MTFLVVVHTSSFLISELNSAVVTNKATTLFKKKKKNEFCDVSQNGL